MPVRRHTTPTIPVEKTGAPNWSNLNPTDYGRDGKSRDLFYVATWDCHFGMQLTQVNRRQRSRSSNPDLHDFKSPNPVYTAEAWKGFLPRTINSARSVWGWLDAYNPTPATTPMSHQKAVSGFQTEDATVKGGLTSTHKE